MPCYSTIRTKLTDGARIETALRSLGYEVEHGTIKGLRIVGTKGRYSIMFERRSMNDAFSASGDRQDLASISRKYAELGVREWAKRKGYSIGVGGNLEEDAPRTMTIINRRGT